MPSDRASLPRQDMREIADALDTAYGCLDLMRSGIRITDLEACIAEVKAAREKALDLVEVSGRA
jgi:hypothetical protein